MNTTMAALLSPTMNHYRSIGELAWTLSHLLGTARNFRDSGRWGDFGPHEILINYSGCVNCLNTCWHSSRIPSRKETTTWDDNEHALFSCILSAVCDEGDASVRWRAACGIDLHMPLKFAMAYQSNKEEQAAWIEFEQLHRWKLQGVKSLNSMHRSVNRLCEPQLMVSGNGVFLKCCVTDAYELRSSPRCYSRWDVSWLTGQRRPKWNPRRETFAKFVLRGVELFKSAKPADPDARIVDREESC